METKNKKKIWTNPLWLFVGWTIGCLILFTYLFMTTNKEEFVKGFKDGMASSSQKNEGSGLDLNNATTGEACNVVGVAVRGGITSYVPPWWKDDQSISADEKNIISSEYITMIIDEAQKASQVNAIIVEIDSGGGSPVAGEEIAESIKRSNKPVIGLIRSIGASAAYWAISPAKPIFASKNSDVGGIGVTASYAENIDKDTTFIQLSTGKYKDVGNPDKAITDDEKNLILRDVKIVHENFLESVALNRNLAIEKIRELADGSTLLGVAAQKAGLIDEIGSLYDVRSYIQQTWGQNPVICWY